MHRGTYTNKKEKNWRGGLHRGTYTNKKNKSWSGLTPGDVYKLEREKQVGATAGDVSKQGKACGGTTPRDI